MQSWIQGLLTNVQSRIQSLTGPFIGNTATSKSALTEIWFLLTGQTILPTNLGTLVNGYAPFASFFYNTEGLPYFSVGMGNFGTQIAKSAGWLGGAAPAAAAAAVPKGIGGLGAAAGGAGGQVAAGLGHGAHVAGLSVPNSWPGATLPSAAKPMSAIPVSEPITSGESGAGNLVGGMPIGGTGARARGRRGPALRIQTHRHAPPHVRGLTPHPTHPKARPPHTPRPARLRRLWPRVLRRGRVNQRQDFFPPHQNSSAKHLVNPLLWGRAGPLSRARGFHLEDRTTFQVKRCYCVVTEGEFVVPSREHL